MKALFKVIKIQTLLIYGISSEENQIKLYNINPSEFRVARLDRMETAINSAHSQHATPPVNTAFRQKNKNKKIKHHTPLA